MFPVDGVTKFANEQDKDERRRNQKHIYQKMLLENVLNQDLLLLYRLIDILILFFVFVCFHSLCV